MYPASPGARRAGPRLVPRLWPRTLKPADGITLGYDAESTLQQLTKKHTAHHNWGIVNENIYGQEIPPPSTVGWVSRMHGKLMSRSSRPSARAGRAATPSAAA